MKQMRKDTLRRITDEAIAASQEADDNKAEQILRSAMQELKTDVLMGRKRSIAMSLRVEADFNYPPGSRSMRTFKPSWLTGAAAKVYKRCEVFAPTFKYWEEQVEDLRGCSWPMERGFTMVLHWRDSDNLLSKLDRLGDIATAVAIRDAIADRTRHILAQLQERATIQAASGKNWALVMSLQNGTDYERPVRAASHTWLKREWLGPVARAVLDACKDFNPTFESSERDVGDQRGGLFRRSGISMLIHW